MSAAFGGAAVTLDLPQGTRLVTTLRETPTIAVRETLTSDAAEGRLDAPPARSKKSDARVGGMVAMYALLGMFALVGLMIWVGG